MKIVNAENFKSEVLESTKPVLVDFFATWCGPCRMIAPILEEISEDYEDKLTVVKLDVDEASAIASEYGVMSIPTLILFRDGKILSKTVGALGGEELADWIDENI